ncbi:MAG: hypothetical protein CFE44_21425 [Burkholderiales bacterium PBB4]|nr:MAG: hypothetical protein CFE44_21425 [Burkholderiales bacterium PBB4]
MRAACVALRWSLLLCVALQSGAAFAKKEPHKSKRDKAVATARPTTSAEGAAEARLIEIYGLIGQGNLNGALQKAEALVADIPHFQLAQLVYGDLLAARVRPLNSPGDVPAPLVASAGTALQDLREESLKRMKALRERPPRDAVPSQFLALSQKSKHAIAVDASRSRLYLFENGGSGLKLIADYYISVGKAGIAKAAEGDQRTPLGVYYVNSNLDPKTLKDFYGSGALPINYPNVLDTKRGYTGSGIWLHGTPPKQFARAPQATDGCVVLANPDLERIIRTVEVRSTPVVIAQQLQWISPQAAQAESKPFENVLMAWRSAKTSGNLQQALNYYTSDFNSNGKNLDQWSQRLKSEMEQTAGRPVQIKDLSLLRWNDSAETMVVTFGEVTDGTRAGTTKRQYWIRQDKQWKIFFEGVI